MMKQQHGVLTPTNLSQNHVAAFIIVVTIYVFYIFFNVYDWLFWFITDLLYTIVIHENQ